MKILFLALGLSAICFSQEVATPALPTPEANGAYYKSAADQFVKLESISMAGGGAKHMGKVFVPFGTPQMVWTYRGAEAPIKIIEKRPVFYVRNYAAILDGPYTGVRNAVIVRFDKKSDHRELQTTSGGNAFTLKSGFSKERVVELEAKKIGDEVYSLTPTSDIPPGEYLLTFNSTGSSGYDFSVSEAPKIASQK
jgi:hypothetical protein